MNNHYKSLAKDYDEVFSKFKEAKSGFDFGGEKGARVITELLNMKEEDHMVDLGAGTCRTAGMVANMAGLKHPVLCVDPL